MWFFRVRVGFLCMLGSSMSLSQLFSLATAAHCRCIAGNHRGGVARSQFWMFVHIASSLSVAGFLARCGSAVSMFDFLQLGSSMSLRSYARCWQRSFSVRHWTVRLVRVACWTSCIYK